MIAYSLSLRVGIDNVDERVAKLEEQIAVLETDLAARSAAEQETQDNATEPLVGRVIRDGRGCATATPVGARGLSELVRNVI